MKYIVLQTNDGFLTREFPILFSDALTHSVVASALLENCVELQSAKPVSAGFISCTAIIAGCHGRSESLNLDSRGATDDALIGMLDYTHGISDA